MHAITTTLLVAALLCGPQGEPDRERLLVAQHLEGTLSVLDPATGEALSTLRVGDGPRDVAASPDGELAVVTLHGTAAAGTKLAVVDLRATRLARTVDLVWTDDEGITHTFYRPRHATFLPGNDEVALVTVESHGRLLMVDVTQGTVIEAIPMTLHGAREVLVDEAGRVAYVAGATTGGVSIVDLGQAREVDFVETGGGPAGLALHPTRPELWVGNLETNSISVIDTATREEVVEFPCGSYPIALAFTPDGERLLCSNHQGGSISVFLTDGRSVVEEVRIGRVDQEVADARPVGHPSRDFGRSGLPATIHVDVAGLMAFVACERRDEVVEIDLTSYEITRRFVVGSGPTDLAWSVLRGVRVEGK